MRYNYNYDNKKREGKAAVITTVTKTTAPKTTTSSSLTTTLAKNKKEEDDLLSLQRKIELATECFTTKGHQILLSDRTRLSKENALTICEYIIAMKREVNPRLCTCCN